MDIFLAPKSERNAFAPSKQILIFYLETYRIIREFLAALSMVVRPYGEGREWVILQNRAISYLFDLKNLAYEINGETFTCSSEEMSIHLYQINLSKLATRT